jgi:D-glycero-D-manno-heptose 1,7-bisphosphate phosphatase
MPSPGLFEEIAERLKVNLSGVYTVGGFLDDIKAAQAASTRPVLLRSGGEVTADAAIPAGVPVFDDLSAFADALLTGQLPTP